MKSALKGFLTPTQSPKRTSRQWFQIILGLILVVTCSGAMGGMAGYYLGAGELPWIETVAILPADIPDTVSLVDIGLYLETAPATDIEYGYGFNCVEDAILLARDANWKGIPAEPARVLFEDGTGHLLLAIPSEDGWSFVDAQTREVVNPRPGSTYMGKKVISVDLLKSYWEPIEWEVK